MNLTATCRFLIGASKLLHDYICYLGRAGNAIIVLTTIGATVQFIRPDDQLSLLYVLHAVTVLPTTYSVKINVTSFFTIPIFLTNDTHDKNISILYCPGGFNLPENVMTPYVRCLFYLLRSLLIELNTPSIAQIM
jgi:hypothetical protein